MDAAALANMRKLLLNELQSDFRKWYYISVANGDGFLGGVFVRAHGHTDAWQIMHRLGLFPEGKNASTQSFEVPIDGIKLVPEALRWKFLTPQQMEQFEQKSSPATRPT